MNPMNRCELMKMVKPGGVGAEIGVLRARFSRRVLKIAKPKLYYLFDAWRRIKRTSRKFTDAWHRENMFRTLNGMRVYIAEGVVRPVCCLAAEAPSFVEDNELDWVYIDADHSYDGCMFDLRSWWPKVKHGGHVIGHDYHSIREPGVVQAVTEFSAAMGLGKPIITQDKIPSFCWAKE